MKMKKVISLALAIILMYSMCMEAFALNYSKPEAYLSENSITIDLNGALLSETTANAIASIPDVQEFFEANDMDMEYYMNWLAEKNVYAAQVSFSAPMEVPETYTTDSAIRSSSLIEGRRMMYGDVVQQNIATSEIEFDAGTFLADAVSAVLSYTISGYEFVVESIAYLFGWANVDSMFGSQRVTIGRDYVGLEFSHRIVAKFVELKAPLSGNGSVEWYPYGFAESDYTDTIFKFYHNGALEESTNYYYQYYTQHYYLENRLVNLVSDAYPSVYEEAADEYAAEIGDYYLYEREIDGETYDEYEDELEEYFYFS